MGSDVEFNDTLKLTAEQGFPASILDLQRHQNFGIDFSLVKDKVFEFYNKPGVHLFHPSKVRCFLVQVVNGKWIYWGHVSVIEQLIKTNELGEVFTSGKFKIIKLYDPKYQVLATKNESRVGESYF